MLYDLYPVLCDKHYCLTRRMWMGILGVEDEFLLQLLSFFGDVYEQRFQNLIITLGIDILFSSLTSG